MSRSVLFRMASGVLSIVSVNAYDVAAQTSPFGECRLGYWSSTRNLDDTTDVSQALCFINWKPKISEHISFTLNLQAHDTNHRSTTGDQVNPREAFLDIQYDHWSMRFGRQIIAWGRADRINPTDYFSPRDFTLLVPEDEDQRTGILAAQVQYHFTEATSVTVVAADFEKHRIPQGQLPSDVQFDEEPTDGEYAAKIDHVGERLDWSMSYFRGYDRFIRFTPQLTSSSPSLKGYYPTTESFGLDFATAFSSWTARGELSRTEFSDDELGRYGENKRTVTRATFGIDRDFFETANINLQYFFIDRNYFPASFSGEFSPRLATALDRLNSDFDSFEKGFTLRVSNRFFNDQLKLELGAIGDASNDSYLIRPRGYYSINDGFKITLGLDKFLGEQYSYFGSREKNDTTFVELTYIF